VSLQIVQGNPVDRLGVAPIGADAGRPVRPPPALTDRYYHRHRINLNAKPQADLVAGETSAAARGATALSGLAFQAPYVARRAREISIPMQAERKLVMNV
jgi:hypothetical protein